MNRRTKKALTNLAIIIVDVAIVYFICFHDPVVPWSFQR